jgi:hypothetical protein
MGSIGIRGIQFRGMCAIMGMSRQDSAKRFFVGHNLSMLADKGRRVSASLNRLSVFGETWIHADLCRLLGGKQMSRHVTPDDEWEEALRIARIMERQSMAFAPPSPHKRKTSRHFERMTEQPKMPGRKAKEPEHRPAKAKIFPFVSRSFRRHYVDPLMREFVYARDGGRCFYCHCDVAYIGAHLDHVLPVSRGGKSTYTNLVLSCAKCNISKNASVLENINEILAELKRRNREVFG